MPQVVKYNLFLSKFAVITDFLDSDEVDSILALEKKLMFSKDQNSKNTGDVASLALNNDTQWLFDKFSALVGQVNHAHFMLDLDGFDSFQFAKYKKNQEYNWHFNTEFAFLNWERKISASIMLTDSEEYLGGEFEVINTGDPNEVNPIKLEKGCVLFYAPWMANQFTTVTSGTVRFLNAHIMGKRGC
jgi:hypothetical protein